MVRVNLIAAKDSWVYHFTQLIYTYARINLYIKNKHKLNLELSLNVNKLALKIDDIVRVLSSRACQNIRINFYIVC